VIAWPTSEKLSKISAGLLEKFKKTAAAKELEQDARAWSFVSWSWMPDPPYTFTLRGSDNEERYVISEGDGRWQMRIVRAAHEVQVLP
jgi:hypothetical protein